MEREAAADVQVHKPTNLVLNAAGYFEAPSVNVMSYSDRYAEGHQSGVTVVICDNRIAANGDIRLDATPGQWQSLPRVDARQVDVASQTITVRASFPDPERNRKGFNPIAYPDLHLGYTVTVRPDGDAVRIVVDLDEPLPKAWVGRVGFNLELFPGDYFGKAWMMDDVCGLFPRQLSGPLGLDELRQPVALPMAEGQVLSLAPETANFHLTIEAAGTTLSLLDGTAQHNNGWFIVRSALAGGKTERALEWKLRPHQVPDWRYGPVLHVSQVGYHPAQRKTAVIECDRRDETWQSATLLKLAAGGEPLPVKCGVVTPWGDFLRYRYARFDFSDVREAGLYCLSYAGRQSEVFRIAANVYAHGVWQPTLEYFLPVQMCHMRVNDRYRVWHGLCHMDDARMAPPNTLHFDGYAQGPSTLTHYRALDPVPGLDIGGWHDAGDDDLRVDSQAHTVHVLALAYEAFKPDYDVTTVNQEQHLVEMHRPDGVPDILQQIEHGVLTILAGYRSLGRLYRGIICPTLRQYVVQGDPANATDNRIDTLAGAIPASTNAKPQTGSPSAAGGAAADAHGNVPGEVLAAYERAARDVYAQTSGTQLYDDRWVFTEDNQARELIVLAGLAAAERALRHFRPELARECRDVAEALFAGLQPDGSEAAVAARIHALAELLLSTGKAEYREQLLAMLPEIAARIDEVGWVMARLQNVLGNSDFFVKLTPRLIESQARLTEQCASNPFAVPYVPRFWGAAWQLQILGMRLYYLHRSWPEIFDAQPLFDALHFILGVHPGANTASFVSGVGARSMTTAYGLNRADFSYVPGGVVSGTALAAEHLLAAA